MLFRGAAQCARWCPVVGMQSSRGSEAEDNIKEWRLFVSTENSCSVRTLLYKFELDI